MEFVSSISFFTFSILLFKSFISVSLTFLYLIAKDLSSLNLLDSLLNLSFCTLILFLKSECSSINFIAVINKSLFFAILSFVFLSSEYFLSKIDVNFLRDSSCPSSHERRYSFPLNLIFTFAIFQFR